MLRSHITSWRSYFLQVFYRTHLLYVPYMILLILHGPNFWKWVIVPGVIYMLERMVRFLRSRTGQGRTYITSGILLPSKVTHLVSRVQCAQCIDPADTIPHTGAHICTGTHASSFADIYGMLKHVT